MSSTLSDQLSAFGFRLLTSVLRSGFFLRSGEATVSEAAKILQRWASWKAKEFGLSVDWTKREERQSVGDFRLDYVRTDSALALLLEHPDSGQPERIWITEIAIEEQLGVPHFATRLSFRQPRATLQPEPRPPRYLSQIVTQIGAVDQCELKPNLTLVSERDFLPFLDLLLNPNRQLPIIAVSKDEELDWNYCPEQLDQLLCGIAHVFILEPEASWALTSSCEGYARLENIGHPGKMFSVYGGAIRCYLPGFRFKDSPYDHRLWLPEAIVRANTRPNGFLNLCLSHTFAAAAARFEVAPLLAPATLRRKLQTQHRAAVSASPVETSASETATAVAPTIEDSAADVIEAPTESPHAIPDELSSDVASTAHSETTAEAPRIAPPADVFALERRLGELEYHNQVHAEEITRLREHLAQFEAARNTAESELLQAWDENEQLDRDLAELNARFSAVNQENSQIRQQLVELVTYKDLSEEMGKRIEVLEGRFAGRGEDPFTRMWQSLSSFVTATQQAATSFDQYKVDARATDILGQENEALKRELHALRMQAASLEKRQATEQHSHVRLRLNDPQALEDFMNDHAHNAVVKVMTSARRDYRKHPMRDLDRISRILTILRDLYLPMKCACEDTEEHDLKKRFDKELEAAHLENGPSASKTVARTYEDDHTVKLEGRTLRCSKIRDNATDFNHQNFFIVNFAWDEITSTLYIKSFDHGATPSDRT